MRKAPPDMDQGHQLSRTLAPAAFQKVSSLKQEQGELMSLTLFPFSD
jgi:hypothetical protein